MSAVTWCLVRRCHDDDDACSGTPRAGTCRVQLVLQRGTDELPDTVPRMGAAAIIDFAGPNGRQIVTATEKRRKEYVKL
jgi:hypothetical protein